MPITGVAQLAKVLADNSRVHTQFIHKTSHADGNSGDFIDLSMAAGNPKFNAYVGDQAAFTPMVGSGNFGIYTGEAEAGRSKYLTHWWLQTMSGNNIPGTFLMLDYVGFYALIDLDLTDLQEMENLVPPTRNADGNGLRLMLVTTTPSTAIADFTISYTNELGISGRIATGSTGVASFAGNIVTSAEIPYVAGKRGPFIALANGDNGVRSVESVTFAAAAGGFAALVLVRPLAQLVLLESPTVTETDFLRETGGVTEIANDAYVNMIFTTGGSITPAILRGGITVAQN